MHKPKKEILHTALWNIAAIATIVAVIFRSQTYVIGSTAFATIIHVVLIFVKDDLI